MPKFPIILTLFLIAAWGYTSWHWYVCNIKGLCDNSQNQILEDSSSTKNTNIIRYEDVIAKNDDTISTGGLNNDVTGTGELYDSPKLSANDVLKENPKPQQIGKKETAESQKEVDVNIEVLSGATDPRDDEVKNQSEDIVSSGICSQPLIGPISLGGNNNQAEVEKLEQFLISRGSEVSINGVYGQDDFEEMKKFQLEYKSEVLDPWDITSPTGYVGKTTIKKINEIACQ